MKLWGQGKKSLVFILTFIMIVTVMIPLGSFAGSDVAVPGDIVEAEEQDEVADPGADANVAEEEIADSTSANDSGAAYEDAPSDNPVATPEGEAPEAEAPDESNKTENKTGTGTVGLLAESSPDVTLNNSFIPKEDWVVNDGPIGDTISVSNPLASGGEPIYVRLSIKEYMEITPLEYVKTPERYMTDNNGDFITFQTETDAHTAYPDNAATILTDILTGTTGYFIETHEGNDGGQYGKFVTTDYNTDSPEALILGTTKAAPANPEEECAYTPHYFGESTNDLTMPIHDYVQWNYPDDKFILLSEWVNSGSQPVEKWIIDDITKSEPYYIYWGQALNPGQTTDNVIDSVKLIRQPGGEFYYAIHADLEAVNYAGMNAGWNSYGDSSLNIDANLFNYYQANGSAVGSAWQNFTQHITNEFTGNAQKFDVSLTDDFQTMNDWKTYTPPIKSEISVTNPAKPNDSDANSVYVRMSIKEYMEIVMPEYVLTDARYMVDGAGRFIRFDTYYEAEAAYPDNVISGELTEFLTGDTGYFIESQKGDANGQYGKFAVTDISGYPTSLVSSAVRSGYADTIYHDTVYGIPYDPSNPRDECEYTPHYFGESTDDLTMPIHDYVQWNYPDDNFILFSEWLFTGSQPVEKWIIDDITKSEPYYIYWGQALDPGQTTSNVLDSVKLIRQPGGEFYYAIHADMEAVSLEAMEEEWKSFNNPYFRLNIPDELFAMYQSSGATSGIWHDFTQHKTNELSGVTPMSGVSLVDNFTPQEDWNESDSPVNSRISVSNTGDVDIYVRLMLKEYFELIGTGSIISGVTRSDYDNTILQDTNFAPYDPANPQDECAYTPHFGGASIEAIRDYVKWNYGNVIALTEWDGTPGTFWIYDEDTGYAYWGQALAPDESTANLLESIELIKQPNEDFYYAIHADMEALDFDAIEYHWNSYPSFLDTLNIPGSIYMSYTDSRGVFCDGGFNDFTQHKTNELSGKALSTVTVTYDANGGTGLVPVLTVAPYGSDVVVLYGPLPTFSHHSFLGWSEDKNATSPTYTQSNAKKVEAVLKDTTVLYAVWGPDAHTVTFVDYDGSVLKVHGAISHGNDAVAPTNPSRTGYTFTGWDRGYTNVTDNFTVKALYAPVTYKVTFVNYDGTVLKVQDSVPYGSSATAPKNPSRSGYTFEGWDKAYNNITSDLTVTAQFKKKSKPPVTKPPVTPPPPDTPAVIPPPATAPVIPPITPPAQPPEAEPETVPEEAPPATQDEAPATVETVVPQPEPSEPGPDAESVITPQQNLANVAKEQGIPTLGIGTSGVPLFGPKGMDTWALLDLMLAIAGVLLAIIILIAASRRRKNDKDDETYYEETGEYRAEQKKTRKVFLIGTAVASIVSIILFVLTQDMRLPMVLVDVWTIVFAVILAVEIVLSKLTFPK
jgi:alternate signal-mediated exported protein